ncbi:MAG: 2-oxoglutarate:acceptor oxidoreductase [Campylobacteraceae bacterium]|nr:2-oxoglutarate:acceptor oxidoreductase [Campylobacteraceae bacterium]
MTEIRFVGVGGQGAILASEILCVAKVRAGGHGMKAATYSSQVRGGSTKVDVILSDEEIIYPYADDGNIDLMVAVANVSYQNFKAGIKKGGVIVADPNLLNISDEDREKYQIYEVPIISLAKNEVGDIVTQSTLALGIVVALTGVVDKELAKEVMLEFVPQKSKWLNLRAYELGVKVGMSLGV